MATELAELSQLAKKNSEGLEAVTKGLSSLTEKLSKTPAFDSRQIFGLPFARTGEDPNTSRGFSFGKMIGLLTGVVQPDEAKVEIDVHNRLHNIYVKELGGAGYTYGGNGMTGTNKFLAPLGTDLMADKLVPNDFRREMKALVVRGVGGADPDEMRWIATKMIDTPGYRSKALSWLNELTGGALVAPPEQGELIELLRNKEALVSAGARTVPLPPQGRLKFPRQTAAGLTYWVGENVSITETTLGTGEVTLQAKKLAIIYRSPNELIRYASPAAEALMRDDMTKSLALGLDLAGLEGQGTDHRPKGLINYANINTITSSDVRANGDALVGQDAYRMIAAIEESNATMEGFLMRPKTKHKFFQLRADAVGQGDKAGPFLFSMMREATEGTSTTIAGYKVTDSTQVSQVRSKGTASNLTYILSGMFSDFLIGMFGAIEFASSALGDGAFLADQTLIRGILSADMAPRHEAAFAIIDNLDVTL